MSSSIGPLALGIVGAVIGAPFGLSAVGFALGSAVGGLIFAPEINGPDIEGPRVGDTDVTASSLGKAIPDQYGITRSAGNVMWSAGLKEEQAVTANSGGGKGGGGDAGSTTSYNYFGNFATAFGRGPARALLKIYADGKLIYDVTGSSEEVQNDKYKIRFYLGDSTQNVDPLIAESINRRLQGLDDVNAGSGPQATYETMADLIATATAQAADGNRRAGIYETYLTTLNADAISGGGVPYDYQFTPAYRGIVYIVFEDMPLADFGNRLPNITAEIAWGDTDFVPASVGAPTETVLTSISPTISAPSSGVGIDRFGNILVTQTGNEIRKLDKDAGGETLRVTDTDVLEVLGVDGYSNVIVRASGASGGGNIIAKVNQRSLTLSGQDYAGDEDASMDSDAALCDFGASAGLNQGAAGFVGINPAGRVFLFNTTGEVVQVVAGITSFDEGETYTIEGTGPIISGPGTSTFALVDNGTTWYLKRIVANYQGGISGGDSSSAGIGGGGSSDPGGNPGSGPGGNP